jgi:hypothetical protein
MQPGSLRKPLETARETGPSTSTWLKTGVNDIAGADETAALLASGVI